MPFRRLALLFMLYFVQGLPFGFQTSTLPVYLREARYSLTVITLAGAVGVPWMAKLLWAPLVERYHWPRWGRRRSWILPLQVALALVCGLAAFTEPDRALAPLLTLAFLMNLFTATMDIAVDGLAVDTLRSEHLGYGNIAQVVGFKLGIITAGGVLLAMADSITWTGVFAIMTGLIGLCAVVMVFVREPAAPDSQGQETSSLAAIVRLVIRTIRTPAARWIMFFIATYKLGETMADVLFRPFLVDCGFSKEDIGLWLGTYGMIASIAGSTCGGILASRTTILRAVGIAAALRAVPIAGEWWLTLGSPDSQAVIAVTMAEHFFGGALTTAMFAFMMAQVDHRIGATHYTAFATVEVVGKSASGFLAGVLADAVSVPAVYGLATMLSFAYLLVLFPISRTLRNAGTPEHANALPGTSSSPPPDDAPRA